MIYMWKGLNKFWERKRERKNVTPNLVMFFSNQNSMELHKFEQWMSGGKLLNSRAEALTIQKYVYIRIANEVIHKEK